MSPLRITFLLPGYPTRPTGGARVVYEYADRLADRGHRVTVVHPRRLPHDTEPPGLHWTERARRALAHVGNRFGRPGPDWHDIDSRVDLLYVPRLAAGRLPEADVLVPTWWATAEAALRFPRSRGVVVHLIQGLEHWEGHRERMESTWRAPVRKVVVSRWLRDEALALGVPAELIRHVPNAVDHETFRLLRPIGDRAPKIATLYHPSPGKGSADALAALEQIHRRGPAVAAVMFGASRRPRGLPDWIEYRSNPAQDQLAREVYNGSSIFLSASWSEGWGLPGAEAMACGCALVSTRSGGVTDYAVHGDTALLAPPRQPGLLVDLVDRLLADDAERVRLAERGRRHIAGFTWERSTDRLEEWLSAAARDVGVAG